MRAQTYYAVSFLKKAVDLSKPISSLNHRLAALFLQTYVEVWRDIRHSAGTPDASPLSCLPDWSLYWPSASRR